MKRNLLTILLLLFSLTLAAQRWEEVAAIEARIVAPTFRAKEYPLNTRLRIDLRTNLNRLIEQCSAEGGGRVVVPAGRHHIAGPIVLKSNVNLYLSEGCELVFSSDQKNYLPVVLTRWEGTEVYNYSPLIYARGARNIAITGKGLIDGQGSKNFATWKPNQAADQAELRRMGREGVPVEQRIFGAGHWLRPAVIEPIDCANLLIEGITIIDATFWVIHPIECRNVTVRGVRIESLNPNSDGCDPESSCDVLIEDCDFTTGDDAIAIKAGRDQDGWRIGIPTQNVIIRNCRFTSHTNAVCIGSEMSGGVRNIFVEQITIPRTTNGLYFKSNLDRGGFIEHVYARRITADTMRSSIVKFDPDYKSESRQNHPTRFAHFLIEDVRCNVAERNGLEINGFEDAPVSDVTLRNVAIGTTATPYRITNARDIRLENVTANGAPVRYITPSKTICLNGTWEVAIGDTQPAAYPATIPVPGVATMASPQLKPAIELDGNDLPHDVGYTYMWYRLHFFLDEPDYKSAILNIRAKYNAQVLLNGREIGYDHHSTYSHARFEVGEALDLHGRNELVVRVGSWNTASTPSKETSAEWWRNSRAAGIWDDVTLELGGTARIEAIKLLPDLPAGLTRLEAKTRQADALTARVMLLDGTLVVSRASGQVENGMAKIDIPSQMLTPWTPGRSGNPKLYRALVQLIDTQGAIVAERSETFGYRSIATRGSDVLINGEKRMFRADNIAFVRALTRWNSVVFDEQWIRTFLRSMIHHYGFDYLRIHLGHAYNKWYEIADQEGIMLHDEWRYMHDDEPTGAHLAEAQIEFRRWVEQNVNHPSIVAWDQENEGNVKLEALKAELREYDPTRLWGEDDYYAKHIYDYSERVIPAPYFDPAADRPSTVLESCRLWLNERGLLEPREDFKTSRTASGWGVWYFDAPIIGQLHADLQGDIGTYFRKIQLQAWAPFALLSGWVNGQNYFLGNLADSLAPKPNLMVLKALNEPIGASVDMLQATEWYLDKTTYTPGQRYTKPVLVWNDTKSEYCGTLRLEVGDAVSEQPVTIPAYGVHSVRMSFVAPAASGVYLIRPRLDHVEGMARRIVVTDNPDAIPVGALAFGGSRTPVEGGEGVIRNFLINPVNNPTPHHAPEAVERAIIAAVGEGLLDKLSYEKGVYRLQSTIFTPQAAITTTMRLDAQGKTLSSSQSETLAYMTLPEPIKRAIVEALGTVPVDESRITRKTNAGGAIYEISVIGNENRFRLDISEAGKLRKKETIAPKNKK